MIDGEHDIETAAKISERVYSAVVRALHDNGTPLLGHLGPLVLLFLNLFMFRRSP